MHVMLVLDQPIPVVTNQPRLVKQTDRTPRRIDKLLQFTFLLIHSARRYFCHLTRSVSGALASRHWHQKPQSQAIDLKVTQQPVHR